jgi:hypothetical protein
MRRTPKGPMLKNRIVGRGEEPPDQLLAHPLNGWKIHPELQQDEVEKVLERVGWVREVLVNKRTGYVVDGHLRDQLALRRDEETVPVTYIDISPEEEKLLILTLDPLSGMIGTDKDQLNALVSDVSLEFADVDLDLPSILHLPKERVQGLTHDTNACTCCEKKCKPGCGCFRESD